MKSQLAFRDECITNPRVGIAPDSRAKVVILENRLMDQRRRTSRHTRSSAGNRRQTRETSGSKWRPVEVRIRGNVAVEVSELPLQVPRYSFRTGTAYFDDTVNDYIIKPYLTQANGAAGATLLAEVVAIYAAKRDARFVEIQERRSNWHSGDSNAEAV